MAHFGRHTVRAALPLSRPPRVGRTWMAHFGQFQCGTSRDHRNEQLQEVTNFIRGRFGAEPPRLAHEP